MTPAALLPIVGRRLQASLMARNVGVYLDRQGELAVVVRTDRRGVPRIDPVDAAGVVTRLAYEAQA